MLKPTLLAISPGPVFSDYVLFIDGVPTAHGWFYNIDTSRIDGIKDLFSSRYAKCVIEIPVPKHSAMGTNETWTCIAIGRLVEILGRDRIEFLNRDVILDELCGYSDPSPNAIKTAVISRLTSSIAEAVCYDGSPDPITDIPDRAFWALATGLAWSKRDTL